MKLDITQAIAILNATPHTVDALLNQLGNEWLYSNEGENTWSPIEIIIHLIQAEKTNWIPRMNIILSNNLDKTFHDFVRMEHKEDYNKKDLVTLLQEFKEMRFANIAILKSKNITEKCLDKTGIHPTFGQVTLSELIATWAVHDLNHLSQIARVLAKQYQTEVGPWKAFLPILIPNIITK